jgi:hypothetical protein
VSGRIKVASPSFLAAGNAREKYKKVQAVNAVTEIQQGKNFRRMSYGQHLVRILRPLHGHRRHRIDAAHSFQPSQVNRVVAAVKGDHERKTPGLDLIPQQVPVAQGDGRWFFHQQRNVVRNQLANHLKLREHAGCQ